MSKAVDPSLLLDPVWYTETFLWIRTKEKKVIPFLPNPIQRDFWNTIGDRWTLEVGLRGAREIVLKARQHGFTTWVLALFYHDTITNEGTNTRIVPHEKLAAEEMLQTIKLFWKYTPPELRPEVAYNSKYQMTFPKLNSQITIGSGSGGEGRSFTIHNLLVTELAFWRNPSDDLPPLLETVPEDGNVIIESTPGALGDEYYQRVKAAEQGTSPYRLHVYPWWTNPKYQQPLDPGESLEPYSDEEIDLITAHNLTPEQIKWRRWKISDIGPRKFAQEYECDFARSGLMVFSADALKHYRRVAETSRVIPHAELEQLLPWKAMLRSGGIPPGGASPDGWRVYEPPQMGVRYVIGADVAEGLETGDADAAHVLRMDTGACVAVLHGRWPTSVYAAKLYTLGRFYHDAILGVERNNHGHSVLLKLHEYQYPNLAWWRDKPGWETNAQTKPLIIDRLDEAIRHNLAAMPDLPTVDEAFAFVHHGNGTMGATKGAHDDLVMSWAIAWFLRQISIGSGDRGVEARVIG